MTDQSPARDLNDLFEADPLELTDNDFQQLVEALREERKAFIASGEDARKAAKKKAKPSAEAIKNISLDDLGL